MVTIKQQLVSSRAATFQGTNGRKFITVHETANDRNGADAQMHANLQSNGFTASWHWQVDDKVAIQSFPHTVRCWHAGDGTGDGNYNSIAIEICVNADGNYVKAVRNAAALVKKIMNGEGISLANVTQHNHWSGKDCPHYLRKGNKGLNWTLFKSLISESGLEVQATTMSLSNGSKGGAVKSLQQDLTKLGYQLAIDSSFGPETERIVKSFQTAYKLTPDGIVGPKTQSALKSAISTKWSAPATAVLRSGSKGAAVKSLQQDLTKLGYQLSLDSLFGPETERIVKSFQTAYKLTPDGMVGPKTQAALKSALANIGSAPVAEVIRLGSKGTAVKSLQQDLTKLGYQLAVDSSFGPETERIVKSFQTAYKLTPDGMVGPKTKIALKSALTNKWKAAPTEVLRYGNKGETVKQLQTYLNKFGYQLVVDSQFGPATQKAVKAFQKSRSLVVDGIVGPKTWSALVK